MNLFDRAGLGICLAALLCFAIPAQSQRGVGSTPQESLQLSTQEHIESESWWPTKSTLPLAAFAGSESCTRCHQEESSGPPSSMRRAATTASEARFFQGIPQLSLGNSYTYRISEVSKGIEYTVSAGSQKLATRLDWILGAGDLGRTFLYQSGGRWYQSEASFYTQLSSLDQTTGLSGSPAKTLTTALGQLLTSQDASACFGCHTVHATTSAGLDPLHAEPGLGCEACHGPSREHTTGMTASHGPAESDSKVFNPARLSPSDSIDFCGACHRSSADAKLSASVNITTAVVRFQPYRLQESECWRETRDERLTCVACHDPHKPLNRNPASYDEHCVQCHSLSTSSGTAHLDTSHRVRICPKAKSGCVSCHMPKVPVASMHGEFTDHFIRIARLGEPFPE